MSITVKAKNDSNENDNTKIIILSDEEVKKILAINDSKIDKLIQELQDYLLNGTPLSPELAQAVKDYGDIKKLMQNQTSQNVEPNEYTLLLPQQPTTTVESPSLCQKIGNMIGKCFGFGASND